MAGRHIKAIVAAYRDGDDLAFRRAAQAIIEEEESKSHTALARDLRRMLASGGTLPSNPPGAKSAVSLPEPPRDRDSAMPLADISVPSTHFSNLVLEEELLEDLHELVHEVNHWPLLDRHGVPRRNRLLLHGPPGCGKTSIAAAIANELSRPLVTVRVESVVSSFLGETSSNLRKVMDFAGTDSFVVLFDEFDSLGKDRDDPSDHGELRRVVNAVLQMIDTYSGPSLLIAATNHAAVLDGAMWRRFDEVLSVPSPTVPQIESLLRRMLEFSLPPEISLTATAESLSGLPHAAAKHVANAVMRRSLVEGRKPTESDLEMAGHDALRRRWA